MSRREPTVAADEPFDIDAQIARNNEFAARVDDVLANTPSPSGRNDTSSSILRCSWGRTA